MIFVMYNSLADRKFILLFVGKLQKTRETYPIPDFFFKCDEPFAAVVKILASALQIMGSIPTQNKHLYELQIFVPGLGVCSLCLCEMYVCSPALHHKIFLSHNSARV